MHDDWRLQVDFEQTGPADALTAIFRTTTLLAGPSANP